MGVPKFYRWISERYPCLSQVVKDYQIPEFDNFYLDMNGIIHACSHPNDDDPTFRISEDKIFNDIFRYIEALFRIIKPQKVMFLAVDGVAPRAKMNQQRGRRFRSAREAQDLVRKALLKGEVLPSEPRFDSNCITPGTDFMARLHEHLKYFVKKKLSSDPTWQKVEIILSGHDVPGEGEHKIMDYIRYRKAQPDYDSNTRHCLYGLDADLIMLGLVSHEPHFSLLREEVRFGKKAQKRQTTPDTITFHLLHLSIMREYLDFEFGTLKDKLPFGYDLERIIDDWVLMGFLVGNDFLPHLPNMHIRQDALPLLYSKYVEILPSLGGYINEGGTLNMDRFETYLTALAEFDYSFHEELQGGLNWLASKKREKAERERRQGKGKGKGKGKGNNGGSGEESSSLEENGTTNGTDVPSSSEDAGVFPANLADFMSSGGDAGEEFDETSEVAVKLKRDLKIDNLQSFFDNEDKNKSDNFERDFFEHKANYYQSKLGIDHVNDSVLLEQAKCYVVGIQWVLHYYYSGVPSWSWFYPYHYAPYVSDIKGFRDIRIEFEIGHPFLPFEQLLAVLPPASKSLLPKAYQGLMVNEDSPVKDFYPVDFETDLNGKQMEWEAVVLIPFIDEERLLQAMKPCSIYLNDEEVKRNGYGYCMVYCHDPGIEATVYPSPWPQFFNDISNCQVNLVQLPHFPYPIEPEQLVKGLCEGVKLDVFFPGFPSLKHIPHTGQLEKRGVRVFQSASRGENLCLTITPKEIPKDLLKLAKELIGKPIYVGWPYLTEAMVHSISDGAVQYYQTQNPSSDGKHHRSRSSTVVMESELSPAEAKQWREEETLISRQYLDRRGIDVGQVELIVYAQTLQGKRYIVDKRKEKGSVCLHKEWANFPEPFAYQTTVRDITAYAPEYKEEVSTLSELFLPKTHCFILSNPHYGSLAEVISVDMSSLRVLVKVKLHPEPEVESIMSNQKLYIRYLPSYVVAERVGFSALLLSRITGNIQVEKGSRDNKKEREKAKIGLNWKFARRNQEILGYARKMVGGGWSFSPDAVKILEEFKEKFPIMFKYLISNAGEDSYYEQDLFPDPEGPETLSAVREWLKQLPSQGLEAVDCGSYTLDKPQIAAIEKAVLDVQRQSPSKSVKTIKLKVKPGVLFKPVDHQGNLIPDPEADYYLFDRVINVSTTNAVPFGLRGTIIGIYGDRSNELLYEILFDEEFLGGLTLRCSQNRAYRLPPSCLVNISYGKRLEFENNAQKHTPGRSHQNYYQSPDFNSYASAAASPRYSEGPTPHSHPFFRSKFRFSGSAVSDYFNTSPQQHQAQGYDAVDAYTPYYGHRYANHTPGSSPHTYGQRSMEFVTESTRTPRSSHRGGRGRGEFSPSPASRGRRNEYSPGPSSRGRGEYTPSPNGRGRGEFSQNQVPPRLVSSGGSASRGRRHHEDSKAQPTTPILMQRRGGNGKKGEDKTTPKQTTKQSYHHTEKTSPSSLSTELEKQDEFSAALQALPKMKPAYGSTPTSEGSAPQAGDGLEREKVAHDKKQQPHSKASGDRTREKEKQPSPAKKDKKRDLSPSVAAMFEAVSASQQSSSDVVSDDTDTPEEGPSAALKSMLNIQGVPQQSSPAQPARIPDALQKLLRAPTPPSSPNQRPPMMRASPGYPPRGPLLPYPGYQQSPPPPQIPLGGIPPYMRYPMPFGPLPATNHITQLYQVAQSAGHPKPEITTENTPQGCIGIVKVGMYKYKGLPCPNPEDAKQSAAAIAISNLPGAKMPLLPYPMYPAGPYAYPMIPYPAMFPSPPPGGYPPSPAGPPGQYSPYGLRPSPPHHPARFTSPQFVPLQVQRKQLHKTVQGTESKSAKPSASPSPPKQASKQEKKSEDKKTVEDKLEKLSLDDAQQTIQTTVTPVSSSESTHINEKAKIIKAQERIEYDGQDTSSPKDIEEPTAVVEEEQDTAGDGGGDGEGEVEGESEDQEELKAIVEASEEQLLKRLERMKRESQETQETIKKLTSYMKVLGSTPDEISPTDEGASPQPESHGGDVDGGATGGSSSVMVGDMDPITQAALLASIKERTTSATSASSQEEAGEVMDPVQVSETDPNNIVIVGEIVGAQIAPSKSTLEEDTHPPACETTAVDPKLGHGISGDLIGQTAQELSDEKFSTKPVAPETEPSQQDSAVEVQSLKEEHDGESSDRETVERETVEAPVPSFHSASKKPKRQLAASFMNITKE